VGVLLHSSPKEAPSRRHQSGLELVKKQFDRLYGLLLGAKVGISCSPLVAGDPFSEIIDGGLKKLAPSSCQCILSLVVREKRRQSLLVS
jgi:hypothetical protein